MCVRICPCCRTGAGEGAYDTDIFRNTPPTKEREYSSTAVAALLGETTPSLFLVTRGQERAQVRYAARRQAIASSARTPTKGPRLHLARKFSSSGCLAEGDKDSAYGRTAQSHQSRVPRRLWLQHISSVSSDQRTHRALLTAVDAGQSHGQSKIAISIS